MFEVCWKFKKISLSDNEWQSFQLKRRSKHRIKSTKKVKWCLMERIMISLFFSDISQLNWYKKSVYWINTTDSQEDFLSSFSWSIHNCTFQRFGGKINHFLLVTLHLLSWQSTWNWIERKNHPISHQMLQILTALPTRVAGFHWKAFTAPSATDCR